MAGGTLALPFLHKVDELNMRTMRVEVSRTGAKSLITEDRMRVDVELEFYLRVQPTVDGVATAAQAIGSKSLSPEGVRNLLEGRFIDAIQATAAGLTMDSLHDRRGEFVRTIGESVRVNLAHSGLQLESVSLTRMDQAAFAALDDNNAFNAVGLRKLAEIIATSKKKRAEIEADADVSVRQTQLEAIKQRLELSRQEEQAQIAQRLEIEKIKAASDADTARAREQATVATESARIEREKETRLAEIQKQRELRRLEIEAQLSSEVRKVDSSIALSLKHAEEAKAQAEAERARTEIVLAQEQVQTERERAVAERSREMALKREQERGEVEASKAQSETEVLLMTRQGRSQRHHHARRSGAHPPDRRVGGHAGADRGRELAHRRADAHAARAIPARPHARDHWPDDEAGREDRQHPHPPGDGLRRQHQPRRRWPAAAAAIRRSHR